MIVTGFTFHISSIGNLAGLSRFDAYSVFLPMSVFSVVSHFIAGWGSDRMPLKYLLMLRCLGLVLTFGLRRTLGTLAGHRRSRIQGGSGVVFRLSPGPAFMDASISRPPVFMGAQVFASAIVLAFGAAESLSGSYIQVVDFHR